MQQIADWEKRRDELTRNPSLAHERTREYASYIMEAMETNVPCKIGGNVLNQGLIPNLPSNACVEVPCLVDACGVTPCFVGNLPEQCAALNRTNINVQLMTIEAAMTLKRMPSIRPPCWTRTARASCPSTISLRSATT